jgi:hypothetical protein
MARQAEPGMRPAPIYFGLGGLVTNNPTKYRRKVASRRAVSSVAIILIVIGTTGIVSLTLQPGASKPSNWLTPQRTYAQAGESATNFSIFWITDTQFLSETNPALFRNVTNWIANNWRFYNGRMVVHTGDIVETGSNETQWHNANASMSVLLNHDIPYTWDAGNHDDFIGGDQDSGWNGSEYATAFNPSVVGREVNKVPDTFWAGDYHNGMDTAVGFSANNLNFLIVNIEWNGNPGTVLKWVGSLLNDPLCANYHVIIATHAYIDAVGSTYDPRWGPTLANFVTDLTSLMNNHSANVFLTMNGHFGTDFGYHTPVPINGRNELMFNRQDCTDNANIDSNTYCTVVANHKAAVGAATVVILTFNTGENQVSARTFDVYAGRYMTDPLDQYTIAMFPNQQSSTASTTTSTSTSTSSPTARTTTTSVTSTATSTTAVIFTQTSTITTTETAHTTLSTTSTVTIAVLGPKTGISDAEFCAVATVAVVATIGLIAFALRRHPRQDGSLPAPPSQSETAKKSD